MKISLIASDENSAPLYRVRTLARLLATRFEVEVLGFVSDPARLDPDAPRDFPYHPVVVPAHAQGWQQAEAELRRLITGDVLYAMKPRPSSFGLALRHRAATGLPVVVDIDDAELAMIHPWSKYPLKNMLYALPRLQQPNNYLATWALQRAVPQADGVTVVSRHFQAQYGGLLLPQYVDTQVYDPKRARPPKTCGKPWGCKTPAWSSLQELPTPARGSQNWSAPCKACRLNCRTGACWWWARPPRMRRRLPRKMAGCGCSAPSHPAIPRGFWPWRIWSFCRNAPPPQPPDKCP